MAPQCVCDCGTACGLSCTNSGCWQAGWPPQHLWSATLDTPGEKQYSVISFFTTLPACLLAISPSLTFRFCVSTVLSHTINVPLGSTAGFPPWCLCSSWSWRGQTPICQSAHLCACWASHRTWPPGAQLAIPQSHQWAPRQTRDKIEQVY